MTMPPPIPAAQYLRRKPPKKAKWYWHVLNAFFWLWLLGGINMFLLQDIPLLLFLLGIVVALHPTVILTSRGQPRTWKKLLWVLGGLVWYCFVFMVAFVLLMFVVPPFAISPQTTYLTEPRSTEFYGIDYQAFIEQQIDPKGAGVPANENGFRLLTETFGRPFFSVIERGKQKFTDEHWHRLCQYLELPTDEEPTLTFTTWWAYVDTLAPEEQEIVKTSWEESMRPWSEDAVPIVRQWLDENDAAFDVFDTAVKKPVLYIPPMFGGIVDTLYLNETMYRTITSNLWIRTRYRLAVGEIDKAWDDVLVQYHFAEQRRRAVWNQSSSLGTEWGANRYAEGVLLHSGWTSNEILRKAEEIAPFQRPVSEDELKVRLRNERLTALDNWQALVDGRYSLEQDAGQECCNESAQGLTFMQRSFLRLIMRPGYVMVKINQRFDELERQMFDNAPMPDKKKRDFGPWQILTMMAWHGMFGSAQEMAGELLRLSAYEVKTVREMSKRQHIAIELTRLVFALEAYRRDSASYPEALDDLLGRYIDEIPLDPFSSNPAGEPFRYILEPPGFLLYSVGPNGIDEDGRGYSDTPKGDDIQRRVPDFRIAEVK